VFNRKHGGVSEHNPEYVLYCPPGTDNFLKNININKKESIMVMFFHLEI
jgi:hypothetical protein